MLKWWDAAVNEMDIEDCKIKNIIEKGAAVEIFWHFFEHPPANWKGWLQLWAFIYDFFKQSISQFQNNSFFLCTGYILPGKAFFFEADIE